MADPPRVYIDACCFIDIAKHRIGVDVTEQRAKNVWHVSKFLEAHKEKDAVVFTSVLTITECLHADGNVDEAVKDIFTRLLTSGQFLILVQPTPLLAVEARHLRWTHNIEGVGGADYIHIQSAITTKCKEFLTTDNGIASNADKLKTLGLSVTTPMNSVQFPNKYLQGNLSFTSRP